MNKYRITEQRLATWIILILILNINQKCWS